MSAGRPSEYNDQIPQKIQEYIDLCQDQEEQIVTGESQKGFTSYGTKVTVKLPTIEGLAVYLGIHKDTVYDWEKKYPEFSYFLNILRNYQAERLINKGLSGDYNAIIAKMILAKHGYADKQEIEHSGNSERPVVFKLDERFRTKGN